MSLDEVQRFISTVGFPVAVCAWLLFERYRNNGALLELVKRVVTLQEEWQHRWLRVPAAEQKDEKTDDQ